MSRSSKKGPYVDEKLMKKIMSQKTADKKSPIKTWARSSQIAPEFVGHTLSIHTGRAFVSVYITEAMVGHRVGEFAQTRTFRTHGKMTEKSQSKT